MGLTHFDQAPGHDVAVGHIRGRWTGLGEAAGCVEVGVRRIQVADGGWSTPAHEHGREEELFYVLAGRGLSWLDGSTAPIGAGDCILFRPRRGGHSLHGLEGLDVLAFGPREYDESPRFPRLGKALLGGGIADVGPNAIEGAPAQFVHESQIGPPELPELPESADPAISASPRPAEAAGPRPAEAAGPRPPTIANVADVAAAQFGVGGEIESERRNLGGAVGSRTTGLKHVIVPPGKCATPAHCHSHEEEIFVVLDGDGALRLGQERVGLESGHVVSRPAGTGVAHQFRAGERGMTFLAYGPRRPGDMCYYPDSNKISFRGLGVVARLDRLDYWDGERY